MYSVNRLLLAGALLVGVGACGGGGGNKTADTGTGAAPAPATPAPAAGATAAGAATGATGTAKPATGATHEVKMVGDANGYHFDPATLTIKQGDAVKFTVVSGPPHNVTFWPDSIPAGAQNQLNANMGNTVSPLTSPMLNAPGDGITVSFAGVPAGTYKYYCTPHLALGMKAQITVQ